ncbi:transporter [Massilia sp. S19_KUP03_FR1]|uniref:transporter n=1 Tax=Massilia sp. S19_KUP03_FR1 TaxID=3025503 RepID=UPI002FCD301A
MKTCVALIVSLLVLGQSAPVRADDANPDRPGIADGSSVVGASRFQVESGLQREWRRDGDARERLSYVPTLLRFGLDAHWEARIEGNAFGWQKQSDAVNGVSHSAGAMPVSLGVKYNLQASDDSGKPGYGAIVRVFPRSGSETFGTHRVTADARLVADFALSPAWSLNPNIGVAREEDGDGRQYNTALFAVTLGFAANPQWNVFVDTGMQSREQRHGGAQVIVDTGVAYALTPDVQLDASVGRAVHGQTPPHAFASAGVSVRF